MSSEIVFIETDKFLRSATSLEQFINRKGNRIVTLIGEHHMVEFSCGSGKEDISISQYVIGRYEQNKQIYICLEYYSQKDPSNIESIPIKDISNYFKNMPGKTPVIPYDNRAWWIGYENQLKLYGNDQSIMMKLKYKDIKDIFINPLETKKTEGFFLDTKEYDEHNIKIIVDYSTYIKLYFKSIEVEIDKKSVLIPGRGNLSSIKSRKKKKVINMLKIGWQIVTDFYLLKEILKNNNSTEIIIIAGQAHIKNLSELLNGISFNVKISEKNKTKNDCAHVFVPIKTSDVYMSPTKHKQPSWAPIKS